MPCVSDSGSIPRPRYKNGTGAWPGPILSVSLGTGTHLTCPSLTRMLTSRPPNVKEPVRCP
jgi:hypothetical protein